MHGGTRQVVLLVVLLFIAALAFLTIEVMVTEGIDVLVVLSLFVLALFAFGIVGALTQKRDDD